MTFPGKMWTNMHLPEAEYLQRPKQQTKAAVLSRPYLGESMSLLGLLAETWLILSASLLQKKLSSLKLHPEAPYPTIPFTVLGRLLLGPVSLHLLFRWEGHGSTIQAQAERGKSLS